MQLSSFTVSNFRSITIAKKVPLSRYSVLIGANNEGKSNILHALAIGMEVISEFKNSVRRDKMGRIIGSMPTVLGASSRFNWQNDFPVSKQRQANKDLATEISFEFRLNDDDISEFRTEIGTKINGTLPLLVRLSRHDREILVQKQGPGSKTLNRNTNKIADFVSRRLNFEYIPAVRTSENAEAVISSLLYRELDSMERLEVL